MVIWARALRKLGRCPSCGASPFSRDESYDPRLLEAGLVAFYAISEDAVIRITAVCLACAKSTTKDLAESLAAQARHPVWLRWRKKPSDARLYRAITEVWREGV